MKELKGLEKLNKLIEKEDIVILVDRLTQENMFIIDKLRDKNKIKYIPINKLLSDTCSDLYINKKSFLVLNDDHHSMLFKLLVEKIRPEIVYYCITFNDTLLINKVCVNDYLFAKGNFKMFSFHSTKTERYFLYNITKKLRREGLIVEIGTYNGGTTIALALGLEDSKRKDSKVVTIDIKAKEDLDYYLIKANVANKVLKLQGKSQEIGKNWEKICDFLGIEPYIKLLWIDGDHSYDGCSNDLIIFNKFLIEGGILVLHDANDFSPSGPNNGVFPSIRDYLLLNSDYSNFIFINSIFYAEKKRKKNFLNFDVENVKYSYIDINNFINSFNPSKIFIYGPKENLYKIIDLDFILQRNIKIEDYNNINLSNIKEDHLILITYLNYKNIKQCSEQLKLKNIKNYIYPFRIRHINSISELNKIFKI